MQKVRVPTIYERLAEGRARLQRLDLERSLSGDPLFGKAIEQRIVWRELLDLELQDFDEQIERICAATQDIGERGAGTSAPPQGKPR
ncbi:MAG TPA: hypothetical protein VFA33_20485 [Bryobacteraceae bacterium]|nr:hypothetical protein [Bryobacteraceae bacterium]